MFYMELIGLHTMKTQSVTAVRKMFKSNRNIEKEEINQNFCCAGNFNMMLVIAYDRNHCLNKLLTFF